LGIDFRAPPLFAGIDRKLAASGRTGYLAYGPTSADEPDATGLTAQSQSMTAGTNMTNAGTPSAKAQKVNFDMWWSTSESVSGKAATLL
jgi:hypothetical protein